MRESFLSEKFLEDAKKLISKKYGNQIKLANEVGYSRKALNHILNSPSSLTIKTIELLCLKLEMSMISYIL